MNSQNQQPELAPGTMIDRYQILHTLGVGGMSVVYMALDTELQREVALKLVNDSLASDRLSRYLFGAEARTAANFSHPNTAVIYDSGKFEERPYIAMEYVPGESLAKLIKTKQFSVSESVRIITQLAECLASAHNEGIVHGDISASNIIIDEADTVRLLDFGLAGTTSAESKSDGVYLGNPGYSAPERFQGATITPATDLFSVGVLFYQLLLGELPFRGGYEAAIAYAVVNEDPQAPHDSAKEIPPHVSRIVMRLLEKAPERRYSSAGELLDDLCASSAHKINQSEFVSRNFVLRWLPVALITAVLVLLITTDWWREKGDVTDLQSGAPIIAALPFEHHGTPESEYKTDGLTKDVAIQLAGLDSLHVISHMSSRQYRDSEKTATEIGSELGCDYLVTGVVRWGATDSGDSVVISATLISVAEDRYLWTDTYAHELTQIQQTQAQIVSEIAEALRLRSNAELPDNASERSSADSVAQDFFWRGNHYFYRSWTKADQLIANDMYLRAVSKDSMFALAYAMLARSHETIYWEYIDRTESRAELAHQAVTRALELNPELPEAQLALGYYYYQCEQNYGKALEQFIRASDDSPANSELYNAIAAVQRRINEFESAALNFEKALRLDPLSYLTAFDVGLTYGLLRRYENAGKYIDRSIELAPHWDLPHIYKAWMSIFHTGDLVRAREIIKDAKEVADLSTSRYYWWLSRIVAQNYQQARNEMRIASDSAAYYLQKAQLSRMLGESNSVALYADSALAVALRQRNNRPDDPRFLSELGLAYAALGDREKALEYAGSAVELLPTSRDAFDALFLILNYTEVLLLFGEYDMAIGQLENLLMIPGFVSEPYLRLDPLWRPLQGNEKFEALLHKVKAG